MQLPKDFFALFVGGVFLATIGGSSQNAKAQQQQIQVPGFGRLAPGDQDATAGVYLPTDRTLSRAVTRAKERLEQHEYHEALQFLHGLLGRDEDWFFDGAAGATEQRGVKATARTLIGELPPEGHVAYERLHGATARRQLEAAIQSGSRAELSNIVRQYFHTAAGYEATLVLAQVEADQGHRLAAAQLYQELIDAPRAAATFEPQLSVMAALNHLAAGDRDAAAETVRSLIKSAPAGEIKIAGNTVLLPAADADLVGWLIQYAGEPSGAAVGEVNWLTARGEPARNARKPGGRPHLRPRWQARVINDPATEAFLSGRSDDFRQRGVVVLPGARPVAVGDVVVMRTPKNVVAVDFQTGKRIWETREDDDLEEDDSSPEMAGQIGREQWAAQGNPLEERVWDDGLITSLSSDGERVFVLRGVTIAEDDQVMGWRMAPGFGLNRGNGEVRATTNQLAAYDMATQGKLAWELDGSRAPEPLDGAFFLGAPLAIDNMLYVMAEVRSATYLFALDPATGRVQWQQQLVGLEQSIGQDGVRRRAGTTPSYDAGILVCPTAASTVIAIDVVKREFAWVYRYPREPITPAEMRNIWQNQVQTPATRANDRWLDSAAVIGEGHVFLTPPESAELHCIDLHTGKQVWKRRQGDSLFVACVDQGNVLLVGADGVQALKVADASPAWRQETVSLPAGVLPAGHGYLSEGRYYLPLTSGEIAAIATSDGKLTIYPARPGAELGNLICYRGSILSQSALMLDKYEQLDVLQQRVEKALANNAADATALRELAELKRTDDKPAEAVTLLKRAYELAPDDALTQEMLAEVLLDALAGDYAMYRGDVALVGRLIHDRAQQIELMRIEASGLEKLGQRLPAFDAYLQLADFTAEGPAQLRITSSRSVRSDRWICGRLGSLWSKANEEERAEMLSRLAGRRPALDKPRTAAELRHYLAHVDELPGADDVRRALARFLIDRKRLQEAEIELLALAARTGDESARIDELDSRLAAASATERERAKSAEPWPRGRVNAEFFLGTAGNTEAKAASRNPPERQFGYRQLRIEQDSSILPATIDWFIAMDCSELVGRNGLGEDVFQLAIDQSNWGRALRDSNLAHAGRLGRLTYVTLGGQVMAIDSTSAAAGNAGDVLWQTDPFGRYAAEPAVARRASGDATPRANRRPAYHNWAGRRRMTSGAGPGICSLGPVTPRGVVFQEQDQLKCVHPLNGELLWVRTDIPAGCELLGDAEYVFAADVGARTAHVIRMVDGRLVGKRDLPKQEWLLTVGRNIAEVGFKIVRDSKLLSIRVSDLYSGGELYNHEFPIDSRVSVMEPNMIAIYEPTGKFRIVDVRSGAITLEHDLEPLADVDGISTLKSDDKLFLMISKQAGQQFKPLAQQPDFPIVDGFVYAFDSATGKPLWPAPAVVRNRGAVLSQPREIPLLVFVDKKIVRDPATGGGFQLRVLCIDQRTGETVYRNDKLPDTSIVRFRIRGERDAEPAVAVEMNAGKIQLAMTDLPKPPRPPANDDLETQRESEERGLRGIGKRMSGVLQGALENPAERERLRQMQLIEQARKQALKAQEETLRRLQLERAERQAEENAKQEEAPDTDDD